MSEDKDKDVKEIVLNRRKTREALREKSKEELLQIALETIEKYNIITHDQVATMMGVCRQTLWKHKITEDPEFIEAIEFTKANICVKIMDGWVKESSILAYKLACSDEHREILNNKPQMIEQTSQAPTVIQMTVTDAKTEALERANLELKMKIEELENKLK